MARPVRMTCMSLLCSAAAFIARADVCDVLVHQFEFAGTAQNLDLLATPITLSRTKDREPLAHAVRNVEEDAEHDPGRPRDATDGVRDEGKRENCGHADEPNYRDHRKFD